MASTGRVLVVDADRVARAEFVHAIKQAGCDVAAVSSGQSAREHVKRRGHDLAVIDLRLKDFDGFELVREWRSNVSSMRVIVVGQQLDVEDVVAWMRLGVADVLQKPTRAVSLALLVASELRRSTSEAAPGSVAPLSPRTPVADAMRLSAAERWARLVMRGRESPTDLKTMGDWARFVGVSASSLTELCRLLKIPPHEARDIARLLRAIRAAGPLGATLEAVLDIADRRTAKNLFARAGLAHDVSGTTMSAIAFVNRQTFVSPHHPAIRCLVSALTAPVRTDDLQMPSEARIRQRRVVFSKPVQS